MTVGSHWPGSGPLTEDQRTRMERVGVCMGCHQNMADDSFWTDQVVAAYGKIVTNDDHIEMMNQLVHDAVENKTAAPAADEPAAQAPAEEPAAGPNTLAYALVALLVGIALGAGSLFAMRRK